MKKFLTVVSTLLCTVFVFGACSLSKATKADYEKAAARLQDVLTEIASNIDYTDKDEFNDFSEVFDSKRRAKLQKLESDALESCDYTEVVEEINDVCDELEDLL